MFVAPAAQAAGRPTDFAFTSFAYGTKVKAAAGELRSGRTAPSWIGCTRQAGKVRSNEVLGVDAPTNNPLVQLGAITSRSSTFKAKKQGIAAGTESTSTVASVVLGLQNPQIPAPVLTIDGLTTTATAWATTDGKLHATTASSVLDINLDVPPTGTPLDGPLAQLLDLVNGTVAPTLDQVIALLQENAAASRSRASAGSSSATRAPASGRDRPSPWRSRCASRCTAWTASPAAPTTRPSRSAAATPRSSATCRTP